MKKQVARICWVHRIKGHLGDKNLGECGADCNCKVPPSGWAQIQQWWCWDTAYKPCWVWTDSLGSHSGTSTVVPQNSSTDNDWNNLGIFLHINLIKIRWAFSESALEPLNFRDSIFTKWIGYLDTSEVVPFISTERECWVFKVIYRYYVLRTSCQVDQGERFIIVLWWTCQPRKRQARGPRTLELCAQFLSLLLACWATLRKSLHPPPSSSSWFSPLVQLWYAPGGKRHYIKQRYNDGCKKTGGRWEMKPHDLQAAGSQSQKL